MQQNEKELQFEYHDFQKKMLSCQQNCLKKIHPKTKNPIHRVKNSSK